MLHIYYLDIYNAAYVRGSDSEVTSCLMPVLSPRYTRSKLFGHRARRSGAACVMCIVVTGSAAAAGRKMFAKCSGDRNIHNVVILD